MCVHACMDPRVCTDMHPYSCTHTWGGLRLIVGVFLHYSLPLLFINWKTCSSLVSFAVIKHSLDATWRMEMFFLCLLFGFDLLGDSLSLREVKAGIWGGNLEVENETESVEKPCLLTFSLWLSWLYFLYTTVPLNQGWNCPQWAGLSSISLHKGNAMKTYSKTIWWRPLPGLS